MRQAEGKRRRAIVRELDVRYGRVIRDRLFGVGSIASNQTFDKGSDGTEKDKDDEASLPHVETYFRLLVEEELFRNNRQLLMLCNA